jgi:DNA-binding NarL/FixJ family response regulator
MDHDDHSLTEPLSHREKVVLIVYSRGYLPDDIAEILHISNATVRNHLANCRSKLGARHITAAYAYALETSIAPHDIADALALIREWLRNQPPSD